MAKALSIILNTDSYKFSHWNQYPPDTLYTYFYIEYRCASDTNNLMFFGLQAFIKGYLMDKIVLDDIEEAEVIAHSQGLPFNKEGWLKVINKHNGYLPLSIKSIPEGTLIPHSHVLITIENTDPDFFWLPGFIETALLRGIWYPSTVSTLSFEAKKIISKYLSLSSTSTNKLLTSLLHDFGSRGVSSLESSMIGGAGHLLNFTTSDNVSSLIFVHR